MGNISKDFSDDDMKKAGLNGYSYKFLVDFRMIDVDDILDIHEYLMNKDIIKQYLKLLKKKFIWLLSFCRSLTTTVNDSNHKKCISLNNEQCMTQPTVINLHPNEYIHRLSYYPFLVNIDRCIRSYNTFNYLCNKIRISKKTENLNLSICNMITGINASKTLT